MKLLNESAETTLNGAINASVTSLSVNTVGGSPTQDDAPFRIWIDREMIIVRTVSGGNYSNCLRGVEGTTAAAHDDEAVVLYPLVPTSGPVTAGVAFELLARVITPAIVTGDVIGIGILIDGGGAAITTGIKGDLEIPFACTINRVTLLADQSGDIQIDIWKNVYGSFPPTDANSITASAPPTLNNASKSQDSTLSGWTTTINAGDILRFNVDDTSFDSPPTPTIQRVTLSLKVTKT